MATFPKGAMLIDEDGKTESLEGVEFELRPLTNLVRIQAARMVRALDSDQTLETMRASFKTFRGEKCDPAFAAFSRMNLIANRAIEAEFEVVNPSGEDPLKKATGAP